MAARVSISVAINPVGDRNRNNLKTTVRNSGKSFYRCLSRFVYFTGLVAFYTHYSSFAACREGSDVTRVALLPKGKFHNLKVSQKQDKREP